MKIIVFGRRFISGRWEQWEHTCSEEEIEWVEDSARAKAQDRSHSGPLLPIDYFKGARYIFEVAYGPANSLNDGDTRVHGISVDGVHVESTKK